MAWITGAEMAAAVCQAGGLGTIAAATFQPEELRQEISRLRRITAKPFAVNIPLRLASAKEAIEVVFEEEVPVIVFRPGILFPGSIDSKRPDVLFCRWFSTGRWPKGRIRPGWMP